MKEKMNTGIIPVTEKEILSLAAEILGNIQIIYQPQWP